MFTSLRLIVTVLLLFKPGYAENSTANNTSTPTQTTSTIESTSFAASTNILTHNVTETLTSTTNKITVANINDSFITSVSSTNNTSPTSSTSPLSTSNTTHNVFSTLFTPTSDASTDITTDITTVPSNNLTTETLGTTHDNSTITFLSLTTTPLINITSPAGNGTEHPENFTTGITKSTVIGSFSTVSTENTPATTNENTMTTLNISGTSLSKDAKEFQSSTGVVLGAIIGSICGIALVCLVAYFLCGTKKSSTISHRRLYEDIRNEPVLRLDNPVNPYDVSYGDSSYYNPTAIDEISFNNNRPNEVIAMGEIAPRLPPA
ncbi:hypothetical protein GDO86_008780 [Hymenochirus boettgeri]|uniref:Mucin-15 n=1 Tax=Hymenochirus boettgeri TaxID=247094 RepID=A0A8T2J4B8_9PIPI|nr:hypothetical protein GDO86_008780 [Hymenochirus boettgeri]